MLEALNLSTTDFVIVLIFFIMLAFIISKLAKISQAVEELAENKNDTAVEEVVSTSTSTSASTVSPVTVAPATAPVVYCNGVELYKTDEKSAATIMAIISHESGIPLNRLAFKSIRLIDDVDLYKTDDKTAATIMAIVSHQSDIPLDRLVFKSIKLIEK